PSPMAHSQDASTWSKLLSLTWSDANRWNMQQPTPANILDYFCERTNPFYDHHCNNEQIRMQRLNPEHLLSMQGVEYVLLRFQEPILFVIRKQFRKSPTEVIPQSLYYIINGVVHAAPDLGSLFNSRLLTTTYHLQCAFNSLNSIVRHHPDTGYSWATPGSGQGDSSGAASGASTAAATAAAASGKATGTGGGIKKESSVFQRQRVDALLKEWSALFPSPHFQQQQQPQQQKQQQSQQQNQQTHSVNKKAPSA
ncbi:hypothetical protein BOX15_Mlig012582g1, partial [Macrostomum lignano]